MKKKLVILSYGGHARSVADIALSCGYEKLIFVARSAYSGENFFGHKVISSIDKIDKIDDIAGDAISAAGDNSKRALECSFIKAVGLNLISLISPSAHIGIGCSIGAGCLVGSHAHLGPQSIVGDGCIINTGAIVEHESRVGMYSHIAVNAAIAGKSSVGNFCMLGIGSSVVDGVSITDCVIVGAGGVVHSSITQAGTYVGVPARKIK